MTAPGTRAKSKIALDQRAPSRHDNAGDGGADLPASSSRDPGPGRPFPPGLVNSTMSTEGPLEAVKRKLAGVM